MEICDDLTQFSAVYQQSYKLIVTLTSDISTSPLRQSAEIDISGLFHSDLSEVQSGWVAAFPQMELFGTPSFYNKKNLLTRSVQVFSMIKRPLNLHTTLIIS